MTYAITLFQPWASLIMIGAKPYEFRPWRAYGRHVGKRIVIHAAVREIKRPAVRDIIDNMKALRLDEDKAGYFLEQLMREFDKVSTCERRMPPVGCGLGTVRLGMPERSADIWGPGRAPDMWAWPMLDPKPFAEPIEARGSQRFWKWTTPVEEMREAG